MAVITPHSSCLGVVLSGGLSSRMGTDKALLNHQKDTMLNFSKQRLLNAGVNEVIISGKQHGLADTYENLGPMGGIYTVIEQYRPNALLILPVDLPLMDDDSLMQLKQAGELSGKACYYQDNYLPLYLPITAYTEQFFNQAFTALSSKVEKEARGPSIRALLNQVPSQQLQAKNSQCLFNTNTPEQWQQAQNYLKKNRSTHV